VVAPRREADQFQRAFDPRPALRRLQAQARVVAGLPRGQQLPPDLDRLAREIRFQRFERRGLARQFVAQLRAVDGGEGLALLHRLAVAHRVLHRARRRRRRAAGSRGRSCAPTPRIRITRTVSGSGSAGCAPATAAARVAVSVISVR
jgi:hypothetical protein